MLRRIVWPILLMLGAAASTACAQGSLVGGPCEGCEAVFEFGDRVLAPVDTLPDFRERGPRLKVTGRILRPDGRTPAAGVVLYVYHTDQEGVYATRGDEKGWGRRHGYLRGWVRTDADGRYTFYTLKPGTYPDRSQPAHIHGTILEPDGRYYWVDSWHFRGDPLLDLSGEDPRSAYGGSGLVSLEEEGDLLVVRRDIILGKNVPGYRR